MASVSQHLLYALDDLDTDQLKRFKWLFKTYYPVSNAALEKADALDTVDLMIKRSGPEEAVKIMLDILRKMDQNHLAEQLEDKHKKAQTEGSFENPAPVGTSSKPVEVFVPITRDDFLQYYHHFTLDPLTVNKNLRLSEGNRVITYTDTVKRYPDHPDRFDAPQVLCRESVCDRRCYWEVKWSGTGVGISVSYKSISRKGEECGLGDTDQSWNLCCSDGSYAIIHNDKEIELAAVSSRRIGVYVDHSAGTLSFYSVSDTSKTMRLMYTVQTTFTQPLYPAFGVYKASVKLCC